ncbi:MAG: GNAT family N-acetyltransferase [Desertimonas sp.]
MDVGEPERLTTDRLVLEPLCVQHADEMVAVLADPRLYEFIGGEPPDRGALIERYRRQVEGSGRDDEQWYNWIARRTDDGVAVGYVQATVTGPRADVAWVIGTGHQRQGYAREAVGAMVRWLMRSGVEGVTAHIAAGHTASAGVAEALGMKPTGVVDDDGEHVWERVATHRPS